MVHVNLLMLMLAFFNVVKVNFYLFYDISGESYRYTVIKSRGIEQRTASETDALCL